MPLSLPSLPKSSLLVLFLITFLFCSQANAQILNIERSRVQRDTANYFTGKAGLNFSMFNRNAGEDNPNNYLQLTFDGSLAFISARHSYLLLNYYNYLLVNYDSKAQRNTVASTGYSHFRTNFNFRQPLSYELFAQVQTDRARGLELRALAGGGIRYRLLRTNNSTIYVGAGVMHEHEEWENPGEEANIIISDLLKSTNYVSLKTKLNEYVSTEGIVYYQVGYADVIEKFRNRVSGDITLLVKLTNRLNLRTNFNCVYEDEPIVPITNFVYSISNGVEVKF
ncbi:DUF481 domain-containing protein [Pontibacter diazotrophicus]|nr:DUF481 domain-containing protein [Pontibacter diazotrophicus]